MFIIVHTKTKPTTKQKKKLEKCENDPPDQYLIDPNSATWLKGFISRILYFIFVYSAFFFFVCIYKKNIYILISSNEKTKKKLVFFSIYFIVLSFLNTKLLEACSYYCCCLCFTLRQNMNNQNNDCKLL